LGLCRRDAQGEENQRAESSLQAREALTNLRFCL